MTDRAVRWRKSGHSGGGGAGNGDCVEIAHLPGELLAVRDSKNPAGGMLVMPRAALTALVAAR